jgi:hypothetical protein
LVWVPARRTLCRILRTAPVRRKGLAPQRAMFRISSYIREIATPTPLSGPKRKPPGPVVIWNLIRRCNLTCKHCYSISADKDFAGELDTGEVFR